MSYTIEDKYHVIKITITTDISDQGNLYLYAYKSSNHSQNPNITCVASNQRQTSMGDYKYDFVIYTNDSNLEIGDVLDRFEVIHTGSNDVIPIYNTHEGVVVQLDGEYHSTINSEDTVSFGGNYYGAVKMTFNNAEEHSIQAVYGGNEYTKMAYTDKELFYVNQPSVASEQETQNNGKWRLEIANPKILSTLKYNDHQKIKFKLTKGGTPVGNKTVEITNPYNAIYTADTRETSSAEGIVMLSNGGYNAGTYKIGAYFVQDGKRQCSVYKTIKIKKADVKFSHSAKPICKNNVYQKKKKLVMSLKDNNNQPMKNIKMTLYHNEQVKTFKTNKNGRISMTLPTGKHNFKLMYKGSKNYNSKSEVFSINVPKKYNCS